MSGVENNTGTNGTQKPLIMPQIVIFTPTNPDKAFAEYYANDKKQREMEQQMALKMRLHSDLREVFGIVEP